MSAFLLAFAICILNPQRYLPRNEDSAMSSDDLLTPRDAAKILGVSIQTLAVWRCERRYNLHYVKVGACVRYRRSELDRFIEQQTRMFTPAVRR